MLFSGSKRKKVIGSSQNDLYDHCLQFYAQPPLENISLTEFETFAVERLKLLKTVENLGVSYLKNSEQYIKKLEKEFANLNIPYRTEVEDRKVQVGPSEYEKRRKDHISHFILRLAYCQTEDLRRWFIQQEMDLFRYRFGHLSSKHKTDFLHKNNLKYDTVSVEEKRILKDKLISSSYGLSGITVEEHDFYKVPFQDALDLVRSRKVYLLAGNAYIPHQEIVTIVLNDFRTRLSKALAAFHKEDNPKMWFILICSLCCSHAYVGQDYSIQKNIGKISLEQIDALAAKSFPLCKRHLHKALRESHHLRHGGRMQYGLFLKGIGLTLEQALQFWRSEFIRGKVDADKVTLQLQLTLLHTVLVFHKQTSQVISWLSRCPFRHSDPELLKQKLQSYKISPGGISQILELVKGMHYQLACQKYFELTHNIEDAGFSLNHPNQYFTESQKFLGGGIKKEIETTQRSQENVSSNAPNMSQPPPANSKQTHEEMGDLDSFFQDE
ncbi:putative DNA primase large subunit [Triplophysa rosa]|uniref:DNA primase large subunit n=1 Tax=Triplophysa rosa TaxID=992332 RepID=A0A9W7WMZ7_TRIRA|nr:putative DNA primase large subunit [Triplophysa rosa]